VFHCFLLLLCVWLIVDEDFLQGGRPRQDFKTQTAIVCAWKSCRSPDSSTYQRNSTVGIEGRELADCKGKNPDESGRTNALN